MDERLAVVVEGRKGGPPAEGDRSHQLAGCGVDDAPVVGVLIEGEHPLRRRVVHDRVRVVRAGQLDLADLLQRLQVEDGGGAGAAVGSETAAKIGCNRDMMDPPDTGSFYRECRARKKD